MSGSMPSRTMNLTSTSPVLPPLSAAVHLTMASRFRPVTFGVKVQLDVKGSWPPAFACVPESGAMVPLPLIRKAETQSTPDSESEPRYLSLTRAREGDGIRFPDWLGRCRSRHPRARVDGCHDYHGGTGGPGCECLGGQDLERDGRTQKDLRLCQADMPGCG